MSNSDHAVLNNFFMSMRTYPALQTLLPSAVLSEREVCLGLACAAGAVMMPPYGSYAILSCGTSLVDFLVESPFLVGGDREEDHQARKHGFTTIT